MAVSSYFKGLFLHYLMRLRKTMKYVAVIPVAIVSLVITASIRLIYWSKCGTLLRMVGGLGHAIVLHSGIKLDTTELAIK